MNCKVCGNTSAKNPSVSFFRFPKENTKCREWAVRCDLLALHERHGTLRFYKSYRICSDHFNQDDIVFDGRKNRLLQYAVPQILVTSKGVKKEKPEDIKKSGDGEIFKPKLAENLCRLCAEENISLTDIYGFRGRILNLENKLKYLPLMINKCDILPLRVCNQCMSKVNQFHDFILKCIRAEAKLKIMFDLKDCKKSHKLINSKTECQEKVQWESEVDQMLNKTPNLVSSLKVSPNLMMCFSRNLEDDCYDQVLKNNLINKEDNFFKQSQPDFAKTNHSTEQTNFIKEVDFSRNISFEHDYSIMVSRDQIEFETKNETENDQNFIVKTRHPCDICQETFQRSFLSNAHSLSNDVQSNLNTKLFGESYNEIFCSRFDFDENTSQTLEKSYTCKICDKKFQKDAFLKKHFFDHHFENICDHTYNLRSSQLHPRFQDKTALKCFLRRDIQNKRSLSGGLSMRSLKSQKTRCQFCDGLFKNREICLAHEKTHTGKTPYECKQCGKAFRSRPSLRQHRSVHSDKRLYNCQECTMSFKRKDTLGNHLRIHTGERPFVCKVCGFAFKQRGDCIKHEKNHLKTFEVEGKEESLKELSENSKDAIVCSTTKDFLTDASLANDGILWNEERNPSLPSPIEKPEEITSVDTLEDIISDRLIPFNFLM